MAVSDLAYWWDDQKRQSEEILTEWVQDNPQWWAVVIAGSVQTSMDLGAGFVDALRFGEGLAEGVATGTVGGVVKGVGKDVLRVLIILGPLGRAGGMVGGMASRLAQASRLRLAVQVNGVSGPCTFQAVNNAMSILKGKNLFLTVQDMAAAVGRSLGSLTKTSGGLYDLGAWVDEVVPFLRSNGAKVKEITGLRRIEEVLDAARRESGVVMFSVRATVKGARGGMVVMEDIYHTVIAVKGPGGSLRFADYGGKFAKTLEQLITDLGYGSPFSMELLQANTSAAVVDVTKLTGEYASKLARGAALVIEGLTAIETPDRGVDLAVPVALGAAELPGKDDLAPPDVIKGSLAAYKARKTGRPVARLPQTVAIAGKGAAPRSDWLTGVRFRLNALGFGAGPIHGSMNARTDRAVRAFQKAYPPLAVDGIPGPKTQAMLVKVCGY